MTKPVDQDAANQAILDSLKDLRVAIETADVFAMKVALSTRRIAQRVAATESHLGIEQDAS